MIVALQYAGLSLLAYLLGSIPFGLILSAHFRRQDIRREGSGNIGATNVLRVAGVGPGLLTLMLDVSKGAFPVFLAVYLMKTPEGFWGRAGLSLVAMSALLGHLYPLYLGLRDGGKGVATAWGGILMISPVAALAVSLVFVMTAWISNRVSVASLSGAVSLPLTLWYATHSPVITLYAFATTLLIIYRHKQNIVRILQGTEPVIRKK